MYFYYTSRGRPVNGSLTDRGRPTIGMLTDEGLPVIEDGPKTFFKELSVEASVSATPKKQPAPPVLGAISQIADYLSMSWS